MREDGAIYLDVRTSEEFDLGHAEGAYNVPWEIGGQVNPDFTRIVLGVFGNEQALIVGCRTGRRSIAASAALLAAGAKQVSEQHGGYAGKRDAFGRELEPGWERSGLPIEMHAQPQHSYRELRGVVDSNHIPNTPERIPSDS